MTQKEALDILKTGRNVFLTGAAGSGKTFVLREYIEYLKSLNAHIGITASTGIAATHMGGTTIHSWSGIHVSDSLSRDEILEIAERKHIQKNITKSSVLIIDEISMLHHFRLDLVDRVIKEVKKSQEPFGGMQVIFCGDFFQLPPVRKAYDPEAFFAYRSSAWQSLNLKVCYLSEQHRQNDLEYLKILNEIRDACVSAETIKILEGRFGSQSEALPTKLYCHNRDVSSENELELSKISEQVFEYEMQERGRRPLIEMIQKSCLAPKTLRLKEGAKVMFVRNNFEEGYVNGTLGTVIKCNSSQIKVRTTSDKVIEVEKESWRIEEDGRTLAEVVQYPLRLAWAITVHKSQGMSLDEAEIDLRSSFEKGMGYVALSRVRSLSGLFLKGFNETALKVNEEVFDFDRKFRDLSKTNAFHIKTMGEKKLKEMHDEFAERVKGEKIKEKKLDTVSETKKMLDAGKSLKDISKERGLKLGTLFDHIEKIKERDPSYNVYNLQGGIAKNKFKEIYKAFQKVGVSEGGQRHLAPVKELLGPKYSYDDLRLVRLFL